MTLAPACNRFVRRLSRLFASRAQQLRCGTSQAGHACQQQGGATSHEAGAHVSAMVHAVDDGAVVESPHIFALRRIPDQGGALACRATWKHCAGRERSRLAAATLGCMPATPLPYIPSRMRTEVESGLRRKVARIAQRGVVVRPSSADRHTKSRNGSISQASSTCSLSRRPQSGRSCCFPLQQRCRCSACRACNNGLGGSRRVRVSNRDGSACAQDQLLSERVSNMTQCQSAPVRVGDVVVVRRPHGRWIQVGFTNEASADVGLERMPGQVRLEHNECQGTRPPSL